MFTIFFWIIILIIAVLSGIYIFLLTSSIKTKAHNHPEATKVVTIILLATLFGFMIFGWNTFSLFNSLNTIASNSPSVKTDNSGTTESKPSSSNSSNTNNSKDGSGYTNF
jgi:heme/copper-type cytochrome/quinol oxidase subunit 2